MKNGALITESLWKALNHKTGGKNLKNTNEDTLQCYVAMCLLSDELKDKPLTLIKVMDKIGKKQRRTEDIVNLLLDMSLIKRTADGFEVIG